MLAGKHPTTTYKWITPHFVTISFTDFWTYTSFFTCISGTNLIPQESFGMLNGMDAARRKTLLLLICTLFGYLVLHVREREYVDNF
jgi:hypothetical protein